MEKIINIFVDNNKVPSSKEIKLYDYEVYRSYKDFKKRVDEIFKDSNSIIGTVSFGFNLGRNSKNTVTCLHYLCKVYVKHYVDMPKIILHSEREGVLNAFKIKIEEFENKMKEFVTLIYKGKEYII